MPTREELQQLADERLRAIKILFEGESFDIVCQDGGYVIEYGLKSAICKCIKQNNYPAERKGYKTHDLNKLINFANLEDSLEGKIAIDLDFLVNWSLISKWTPEFRYKPIGTSKKKNAGQYISAIESKKGGVYPWIKENW